MTRWLLVVAALATGSARAEAPETVDLDLSRLEGTWYELARVDSFFRRGCTGNTTTYTRAPEGHLEVRNRCSQGSLDGPQKQVSGRLWRQEGAPPGQLRLQVVWPLVSDFWVVEVGPALEYAAVSNAKKTTLTVLSRTAQLDEAVLASLLGRLRARGYPVDQLTRTVQPLAPDAGR
ncbi:MAG: lipocalin family protein [Myxococcus sp.]|nr:lipocalin family protein [Myxococcus sp.]